MVGGAAGLGAAAMIGNTSAFQINSDQGLSYFNRSSNQSQFNVSPDGVLDAKQIGTIKNPIEGIHSKSTYTQEVSTTELNDTHRIRATDDLPTRFNDASTGDKIVIEAGTWDSWSKTLEAKSDQTIIIRGDLIWSPTTGSVGGGGDAILIRGTDATNRISGVDIIFDGGSLTREQGSKNGQLITAFYAENCSLRHARIEGNDGGLPVYWGGPEGEIGACKNLAIVGGEFSGGGINNPPVEISSCHKGIVSNIYSERAGTNGLNVSSCTDVVVSNSVFGTVDGHGILQLDSTHCKITNNITRSAGQDGIHAAGSPGVRENNTIEGNTIISPADNGITILVEQSSIANNRIIGSGKTAIKDGGRSRTQNTIKDNLINGAPSGIDLDGLYARVVGNTLKGIETFGIKITDPANVTISENDIWEVNTSSGGYAGILLVDGSKTGGFGSIVSNNKIRSGATGIEVQSDSVRSTDWNMTNNFNTQGVSIAVEPKLAGGNTPAYSTDVRALGAVRGNEAYHDGTNANTVGPAFYDGTGWFSLVDGSAIT